MNGATNAPAAASDRVEMQEVYSQLPLPLMIGLMLFGVVVTLVACTPSDWVGRALKAIRKRIPQQ